MNNYNNKEDKNINININSGTIIKVVLVLVFFGLLYFMRDLALVLVASIIFASSCQPAIRFLGRFKINRVFAAVITYFFAFLIFGGSLIFLFPPFLNDISRYLSEIPKHIHNIDIWSPLKNSEVFTIDTKVTESFSLADIIGEFKSSISEINNGAVKFVSRIFGGFFSFILIVVLSFYLAVQEDGVASFLKVIIPIKHQKYAIDLWRRSQEKIGLWMQGQLALALIMAFLVFSSMSVIGLEHALVLGLMAGILDIVPIFGAIIAMVPGVIEGFSQGGTTTGLIVLLVYVLIQQAENHIFYPAVVKKLVGIPPIVVILALIAGFKLGGFLGVLLAVPISACLMEFYNDIQKDKLKEEEELKNV